MKFWDKKYKKTADFIVIEGPMAGGHLGFHKEQIGELTPDIYAEEVKEIITVVRKYEEKYEKKIPVILAGGIYEHTDYEKAFTLGADGVQIATRFVTTEECDADERYKQAYIQAKKRRYRYRKQSGRYAGKSNQKCFFRQSKSRRQNSTNKVSSLYPYLQSGRNTVLYHRSTYSRSQRRSRSGSFILRRTCL